MTFIRKQLGQPGQLGTPAKSKRIDEQKSTLKVGSSGVWNLPEESLTKAPSVPNFLIPQTVTSGTPASGLTTEVPVKSAEKNRFEEAEAEKHEEPKTWADRAKKIGATSAFATLSLLGIASNAAQAQVSTVSHVQQQQVRSQVAIRVNNPQEAIESFTAESQLYVVGNPQLNGLPVNLQSMQEALKEHPNVYVVINGNYVDDLAETEADVGLGIANSDDFQGVREQLTGEQNGVLFYINLNVKGENGGTDRATMMRTEGLADKLGVGDGQGIDQVDAWWPDGQPGKLGNVFIDAMQSDQHDLGSAMGEVFQVINNTISNYAVPRYRKAESQFMASRTSLTSAEQAATKFQEMHGEGGELGSPNLEGWENLGREMTEAFEARDFDRVKEIHDELVPELQRYQESASGYLQATQARDPLKADLRNVLSQLEGLPDNEQAQVARDSAIKAREAVDAFEASHEAKSLQVARNHRNARLLVRKVQNSIDASHQAQARATQLKIGAATAATIGLLVTGFVAKKKASKKKEEAALELQKAQAEVAKSSDTLMEFLDRADFNTVAGFTGETKVLTDKVMDHALTALTMVGGAEKFFAEAESLIDGKNVFRRTKNVFLSGAFEESLQLTRRDKAGKKMAFDNKDASRVAFEEDSKAATWQKQIVEAGESRQFKTTLFEMLGKMKAEFKSGKEANDQVLDTDQAVKDYVEDVKLLDKEAAALQSAGKADGLFTAGVVTSKIVPEVLPHADGDGVASKAGKVPLSDPIKAHRLVVKPNQRVLKDTKSLIEVAKLGRESLLPNLTEAQELLDIYGVKTDWATEQMGELSQRLESLGEKTLKKDVSKDAVALREKLNALDAKVTTVAEQDKIRRTELPKSVADGRAQVAEARQEILSQLQAAGHFRNGKPEEVLVEKDAAPLEILSQAEQNLPAIKERLSEGDIKSAGEHIENVEQGTQKASEIVATSLKVLKEFPSQLQASQEYTAQLSTKLKAETKPALSRMKTAYDSQALQDVSEHLGSKVSIEDKIGLANDALSQSGKFQVEALASFDRAKLLGTRTLMENSELSQKEAAKNLDSVEQAEKSLAEQQGLAEKGLDSLKKRLQTVKKDAAQAFVRPRTAKLLAEVAPAIKTAEKLVMAEIKSPFQAKGKNNVAQVKLESVEKAILKDQSEHKKASSAIQQAEKRLATRKSELSKAEAWQGDEYVSGYGNVSHTLGPLPNYQKMLKEGNDFLRAADQELDSQNYEEAARLAGKALKKCEDLSKGIGLALKGAKDRLEQKATSARLKVKAERQRSYSSSSSYSSSGSSYSSSSSSSTPRRTGRRRSSSSSSSSSSSGTPRRTGRRRSSSSSSSSSFGSSRRSSSSRSSSSRRSSSSSRRSSSGSRSGRSRVGRSSGGSSGRW